MAKNLRDEDLKLNIIVNGDKAKKELGDLEKNTRQLTSRNKELRAEKRKLERAGKQESQQYKEITREMRENNRTIKTNETRMTELRKEIGLTGLTMKQLRTERLRLKRLMDSATPGTPQWKKYRTELDKVERQIGKVRTGSIKTRSALTKLRNAAGGLLPAFGFAAIIAGISRVISGFAKFDDTLADAMKTTGLTRSEINRLNRDLQKIDTRSSQEELLGLVRVGGKLGIQGRNDLLQFASAADKINVSLNEDLGGDIEGTLRKIGKLVDIFGLKEEFGIESALLRVGSVINELGATSTANEEYMVDFTSRLAGFAPNADLAISDVLGLAATLDQFGQRAEVSSTVIGKLLVAIGTDIPKFAGIANMSIENFSKTLEEDANEALLRVLEGSKSSKKGLEGMVETLTELGIDGQRSATVLGVLSANTETLRKEQTKANQEFESGNSILTEFNNKNTTVQAKLEKMGKWFKNQWLNVLNSVNEAMKTNTNRFSEQLKQVTNLQTNLVPLIDEYETLQNKTNLSADEQDRMKTLITDIAAIAPEAITQFDQYGNAIGISADRARDFIETQKAILKFQNADAIEETESALEKQRKKYEQIKGTILSGTTSITRQTSSFGTSVTEVVRLSSDEISELNSELKKTGDSIKQNELLLKGLTGDYLDIPENENGGTSPEIGTRKTVGNVVYEWDGKTWKQVEVVGGGSTGGENQEAIKAIEIANKQRILALQEQYGQEENMQKLLHARLLANELAYLQAKAELETDESKKLDLQIQIIDAQNKYNEAIRQAVEPLKIEKEAVDEVNASLLEEDKLLSRIENNSKKAAAGQNELTEKLTSQAQMYQDTIMVVSDGLYEMMQGGEDAFKEFGKKILILALEQLKIQAQLAAAGVTVQSLAQPDSIATFGAAGLARAAIIVGLIEAAFAGLEGLVSSAFTGKKGKKDGGFTSFSSSDNEVVDYVHANEWVANAKTVRNPAVRRFIDVFEFHQRAGNIQQLDLNTIMASLAGGMPGRKTGGYSSQPGMEPGAASIVQPYTDPGDDPAILDKLDQMINRIEKMNISVAIDRFEKERERYLKIKQTSGL